MKIIECSGCGKLAIIENEMCANCETEQSTEQNIVNQKSYIESSPISDFNAEPYPPTQSNEVYPNQLHTYNNQPRQHFSYSNCRLCKIQIQSPQTICFECSNKKFPVGKFFGAFALAAILIGGFYFYKSNIANSPSAIFKKYERVTGTDKYNEFKSLSFTGDSTVTARIAPHIDIQKLFTEFTQADSLKSSQPRRIYRSLEENFTYTMIFQQPNKSSIEFLKKDAKNKTSQGKVVFKQVFDGVQGWKYSNMFNQPVKIEDTGDGFSDNRLGVGFGEFDSVEFLNDKIKAEYGEENINMLKGLSTFWLNNKFVVTESKVIVEVKQTRNGKTNASLMMFDERTGFLLEILNKDVIKGSTVISKIRTNSYKTFSIKRSGQSEAETVILPEKWVFEMEELNVNAINDSLYVTITLGIDNIELDVPIDDSIFAKPSS